MIILVDTGPLIALCDPRDALATQARKDAGRLIRRPMFVTDANLTETLFMLDTPVLRERLRRVLAAMNIRPAWELGVVEHDVIFSWLATYSEHRPDFADAQLVAYTMMLPKSRIWTYDREFRTIWRRLDGSAVPVA